MRRPLSRLARIRIFDAAEGRCHICEQKIQIGQAWELEHRKPLWLGGADDESNMAPAHVGCHSDKTRSEAPMKAKSDRVRAAHLGIKKPRTIRAWRKFNGTAVYAGRDRGPHMSVSEAGASAEVPWSPDEMSELLDGLATAADRLELSYSETAHIARNAAALIRRQHTNIRTLEMQSEGLRDALRCESSECARLRSRLERCEAAIREIIIVAFRALPTEP